MTERADSKLSRVCEDSLRLRFLLFGLLLLFAAACCCCGGGCWHLCETTTPFCPFYRKCAARLTNHTLQ